MPLSQPQSTGRIKPDCPFSFSATIEVEPVIDPQDYVGLKLEKQKLEVSDRDVDVRPEAAPGNVQHDGGRDGTAWCQDRRFHGHRFSGFLAGKAHKDMKSENYLLEIGSGSFIPGFEEQITGMSKNETKEFTVKFPADYHKKDLADP